MCTCIFCLCVYTDLIMCVAYLLCVSSNLVGIIFWVCLLVIPTKMIACVLFAIHMIDYIA